jgi:putative ABC transport system permease protein
MLNVTLKGLLAKKWRLLMTALSITLGVGFITGTVVLSDTIVKTFDDLFADVYKGTDAVVRTPSPIDDDTAPRGRLDASALALVRDAPDVREVVGNVSGTATLVGKDGKAVGTTGAPTFGFNWTEALNPFTIVEGRAPAAAGEIAIDRQSARSGDLEVGDQTKVQLPKGTETFTVVGIARFGRADTLAGASVTTFTTAEAQRVFDSVGEYESISVSAAEGVSQPELKASLQRALGNADAEVLTGEEITEENQSALREGLQGFTIFLQIFGYIALFVGTFIIYNTFSILVAQRQRETALLRAVGATRRQVLSSVLVEAAVMGVVAGAVGIGFGVLVALLLKVAFSALGFSLPASGLALSAGVGVNALVLGVVVAVGSAYFPARRASKVPPIAAMRDVSVDRSGSSRIRAAIGVLALLAGGALLASGLAGSGTDAAILVGASFVVVILGTAVLGAVIARPMSAVIGAPLPRLRGMTGTLARRNAMRNPRRTASTALALTIGVAIVAFVLVMASSIKASVAEVVDQQVKADFVLTPKNFQGFSPDLARRVGEIDGVTAVSGFRAGAMLVEGDTKLVNAIDPATATQLYDIVVKEGALADLAQPSTIAVSDKIAAQRGWTIGRTVDAVFAGTGQVPLRLVATIDSAKLQGVNWIISTDTFGANFDEILDFQVYVKTDVAADDEAMRTAIAAVVADYPSVDLQDRSEFKRAQQAQVDQLVGIIYVMLFLAIVIALLGITNTIALSVHERTHELGLLRAVGMTRSQLRSSIRWEAVIIAVLGTALGLVIGIVFGIAILGPLESQGLTATVVPVGQLVFAAIVAALAGVLAAVRPAAKAAKLDILHAISAT